MSQLDDFNRRMTLGQAAGYSNNIHTQVAYSAADSFLQNQQNNYVAGAPVAVRPGMTAQELRQSFPVAFGVFFAGFVMLSLSTWMTMGKGGLDFIGIMLGFVGFIAAALGTVFLLMIALKNIPAILKSRYFWVSVGVTALFAGIVGANPGILGYGVSAFGVAAFVLFHAFMIRGFIALWHHFKGLLNKKPLSEN